MSRTAAAIVADHLSQKQVDALANKVRDMLKENISFHAAISACTRQLPFHQDDLVMHAVRQHVGSILGKRNKSASIPLRPAYQFSAKYKDGDLNVTDIRSGIIITFVQRTFGPLMVQVLNTTNPSEQLLDAAHAFAFSWFKNANEEQSIVVFKKTKTLFVVHISAQHEIRFTKRNEELEFVVQALASAKSKIPEELFKKAKKMAKTHFGLNYGPLFEDLDD